MGRDYSYWNFRVGISNYRDISKMAYQIVELLSFNWDINMKHFLKGIIELFSLKSSSYSLYIDWFPMFFKSFESMVKRKHLCSFPRLCKGFKREEVGRKRKIMPDWINDNKYGF